MSSDRSDCYRSKRDEDELVQYLLRGKVGISLTFHSIPGVESV